MSPTPRNRKQNALPVEPEWYRDAVVYELHVRAFADSDGDGRGDFRGLASRLDYLQQLGITAVWLLPFYPSPLRDDGYDIADYTAIRPELGTLADFRYFISEAHRRHIRVITELVLNHTSDQHPWFQRARTAERGSYWRDFYVWSDTPDRFPQARVIFSDFEHSNWAYDNVAGQYYWHRFYSHQPDLNYRHPPVQKAMLRVVDFWLALGVDGLRLDAIPYLFAAEGTTCENLPETHAYLRLLREHVDARFPGRLLLAEANQWPEDAAAYFGAGDECHMAFHFPLMPRLFMGLRMEDRFPIIDIMQQTPEVPPGCQWALFLRNHDELTLEMVTDEERDYMYRAYAADPTMRLNLGIRRRLASLLHFHRQKIELMYGLLLSLPGTPFLYYGDEIGMGDNVYLGDRNGVRTPMQWSADRNAGFSEANPHRIFLPVNIDPECHYESVNVEAQLDNPDSLLRWVRRLVALRRRHHVFGRGTMSFVRSDNPSVLAFVRGDETESVLVVANLSRFAQFVELDLSEFAAMTPLELFGQQSFPQIGELPYLVTLSPHTFYWFSLRQEAHEEAGDERPLPEIKVPDPWWGLLEGRTRRSLESVLPATLQAKRWFSGKSRRIHQATIESRITLASDRPRGEIVVVHVEYFEGEPERYLLPIAVLAGGDAERLEHDRPESVLARTISHDNKSGVLVDAHYLDEYAMTILRLVSGRRRRSGTSGERLTTMLVPGAADRLRTLLQGDPHVRVVGAEHTNTSVIIGPNDGPRVVLKTFRRVANGMNPEIEIGRHLAGTEAHVAPLIGAVELEDQDEKSTASVLSVHEYVEHEADAWTVTVRNVGAYLEQVGPMSDNDVALPAPGPSILEAALAETPAEVATQLAEALSAAELLGQRTGELHRCLSEPNGDEAFEPELVTPLSQRSLYQSIRTSARRTLVLLRRLERQLEAAERELAHQVLDNEDALLRIAHGVLDVHSGVRCRVHGDLHLAQVLSTGRDYVFVDFEGEPTKSIGQRRLKRSVLADVAGILRSYSYAAHTGVVELESRGETTRDIVRVRDLADRWAHWVGAAYVRGYLPVVKSAGLLPEDKYELDALLRAHLLDKALYEVRYELTSRPDWVGIPLVGLASLMTTGERATT